MTTHPKPATDAGHPGATDEREQLRRTLHQAIAEHVTCHSPSRGFYNSNTGYILDAIVPPGSVVVSEADLAALRARAERLRREAVMVRRWHDCIKQDQADLPERRPYVEAILILDERLKPGDLDDDLTETQP